MSMMDMTVDSLTKTIGEPVPEMYVIIAKNSVVGLDAIQIAELLGVTRAEIEEVLRDETYKSVRLLIASEYAKESLDADFSWDAIESASLKNLAKRVPHTQDTDQLLRIAAVANKAQRRHRDLGPKVLDPSIGGVRIPLVLTERIVRKLQANGDATETRERRLSLTDGSAGNPSFLEVDKMLGVTARQQIGDKVKIRTHEPDFGLEDLEYKG